MMELTRLDSGSYQAESDPGEPTTGVRRISVTDAEKQFLADFARRRVVLEIGTGLGVSTRALDMHSLSTHTFDPDPWVHKNIFPTLSREGVACWEARPTGKYDMVFIDADHTTDAVRDDIAYALTLRPYLIVCHDAKMPQVAEALDDTWTMIDTYWGLALKWV